MTSKYVVVDIFQKRKIYLDTSRYSIKILKLCLHLIIFVLHYVGKIIDVLKIHIICILHKYTFVIFEKFNIFEKSLLSKKL